MQADQDRRPVRFILPDKGPQVFDYAVALLGLLLRNANLCGRLTHMETELTIGTESNQFS
jgi:hypothetical protein